MESNPLASLPKTWMIDLDGTILVHNGHLNGGDELLAGTKEFFDSLDPDDVIIFTTARGEKDRETTEKFLQESAIQYSHIIFGVTKGIRILINDKKPDNTLTAYAINVDRNGGIKNPFLTIS